MRNVAVAMGNSRDEELVPALGRLLDAEDPMVRRHAAWGLAQFATPEALRRLRERYEAEPDSRTRVEIEIQLARAEDRAEPAEKRP